MAAVLGIDLCEAEDLGVCQLAAQLLLHLVQVFYFLGRQGQAFLFVIALEVLDIDDRGRGDVDGEDVLVQSVVAALQHGVECALDSCIFVLDGEVLLDARDTAQVHVLRYLDSIGTPWRDHFAARADEVSLQAVALHGPGIAVEPAQFLDFFFRELMVRLRGNDALLRGSKKQNHIGGCYSGRRGKRALRPPTVKFGYKVKKRAPKDEGKGFVFFRPRAAGSGRTDLWLRALSVRWQKRGIGRKVGIICRFLAKRAW